jgi:adenylate cyclase
MFVKAVKGIGAVHGTGDGGSSLPAGNRRLAAIVFADIVGYSLLMAADEQGTYDSWMAMLRNVVRPAIERHAGRIVDLAGDGVLAEFQTPLDAVGCARSLQRTIRERHDAAGAAAAPIALRIAVHQGEVFVAEGRIFGDAVNVAARLQEHAQPGCIVISEAVHMQLHEMFEGEERNLGTLELKNINRPVQAYSLNADAVRVALPIPRPPGHALPSIAVLPLRNLGGDAQDDYFAAGIIEDIITSLAGLRELFVISGSSTLAFRDMQPDARQAGRALGVRYVLTGNLRRSPNALRINFQLCDARTGAAVWGDRMEIPPGDLFEVQDEVVRKVVAGIAPNIRSTELRGLLRKRPESFTAYDHTLRALHAINGVCREKMLVARGWLDQAMADDPGFAMPVAWAAWWYSLWIGQGWSTDVGADKRTAMALTMKAIALDEQNALALAVHGHLLSYLCHQPEAALTYFERALNACPNSALAWMYSSNTFAYLGRGKEALARAEYALRLSPQDLRGFLFYSRLGIASYAAESYEEAARWMRVAHSECPTYTTALKVLAATLAALDRIGEAREISEIIMSTEPGFRLGVYERERCPIKAPDLRARFIKHLRTAGLPD